MHKTKDGKVMASLTEVKNQTGNIFTAADRYGAVYITSYNKVRYKIIKEESEDELDIAPRTKRKVHEMEEAPVPTPSKVEFAPDPIKEVVVEEIEEVKTAPAPVPVYEAPAPVQEETASSGTDTTIMEWDRNSSAERNFIRQATKTLLP